MTMEGRAARWALAATAAVVVFLAYWDKVPPETMAQGDLVSLVASALDCVEGDGCRLRHVPGSVAGLHHGGGFPGYLAVVLGTGGTVRSAELLAALAIAVAFGLLFVVVARSLGSAVGGLAVLLPFLPWTWLPLATLSTGATFWNPSLLAPFAVLLIAGTCRYLEEPRYAFLACGALGAAMAAALHLTAAAGILFVLALVAFAPRHDRFRAALVALLVTAVVGQALYGTIFLDLVRAPGGDGILRVASSFDSALLGRALPHLVLLLGVASSFLFRQTRYERRLLLFLACTHLPLDALLTVVAPGDERYRQVLSPGMALLAAITAIRLASSLPSKRLVERIPRRARVVAVLAPAVVVVGYWAEHAITRTLAPLDRPTFEDIEAVATRLGERGWTSEQALLRLGGNELMDERYLREALALYPEAFAPLAAEARSSRFEMIVMEGGAGEELDLLMGSAEVEAIRTRHGAVVLLREYEPYLVWDSHVACFVSSGDEACFCAEDGLNIEARAHPADRLGRQAQGRMRPPIAARRPVEADALVIRVPLEIPPGSPARLLTVPATSETGECRGAILHAEGVPDSGGAALPSGELLVGGGEGGGGMVIFGWDLSSPLCAVGFEPPLALMERPVSAAAHPTSARFPVGGHMSEALACLEPGSAELVAPTPPAYPEARFPFWYVVIVIVGSWLAWAVALGFCAGGSRPRRSIGESMTSGARCVE